MKTTHILFITLLALVGQSCTGKYQEPDVFTDSIPVLYPDYTGVTFPVNIAPPNFIIRENGEAFQTEIGYGETTDILYTSKRPEVIIPPKAWKNLLQKAAGKEIFIRITLLNGEKWKRYADIRDTISAEPIDEYLVYRLLYPGYELWNEMGIYQRNLTNYEETAIAENRSFDKQCINCHTFNQNSPETMMMHVRGKSGGTLISKNGQVKKVNTKPAGFKNGGTYAAWHPSGRYIAFSLNEIQQFFHSSGRKPIEVSDLAADLTVYDTEKESFLTDSLICDDAYMETFPNWTPDGKTLYFCRGNAYKEKMPLDSIRYDLYSIEFDTASGKFGNLQCVYKASEQGKSVSFPRVSPDGKHLMFTLSDYGNFSIWHPESELCLLTFDTGEVRLLDEVNSNDVESFHTWSSSGRWFVFSSKRLDGLWARPFFAAFNPETGKAGKPFLLPQKNPRFYDTFTKTYNLPELIKKPVRNGKELIEAIF